MHRRLALASILTVTALGLSACPQQQEAAKTEAAPAAAASTPGMETDEQKTIYALGLAFARNLEPFHLSESELGLLIDGMKDGALKREPRVPLDQYAQQLQNLARSRATAAAADEVKAAEPFLAQAAAEPGAQKSETGVIYQETAPGNGESPKPTDVVKVHYHGTLRDGSVFDSSRDRGQPAQFPLNRVIPCWTEAIQKMKVGSKAVLTCPAAVAYGDRGAPPKIQPGAALRFEVELLEIVPQEAQAMPPGHPAVTQPGAKPADTKPGAKKADTKKPAKAQ